MNWFKIYCKHVTSLEFTDSEIGKLVRYQANVAHHERLLTEKETRSIFTRNSQRITEEKLRFVENFTEISLEFIANKVLEDVLKIRKKYKKDAQYHAQQKEKDSLDRSDDRNDSRSDDRSVDKIREDKTREDNIYIGGDVTSLINYYNKQFKSNHTLFVNDLKYGNLELNMKKALEVYSQEDLFKAIDNFKKDPFFKEKKLHRPILLFKDLSTIDKYLNSKQEGSWKDKYKEDK